MARTHFKGPVFSENGFEGELVLADPLEATDGTFSGDVEADTVAADTSLSVGGGTAITSMLRFSKSVTVTALAAAAEEQYDLACSGVLAGDSIMVNPNDSAAETGLGVIAAWVSASDQVTVRVSNFKTTSLTGSTSNWNILAVRS